MSRFPLYMSIYTINIFSVGLSVRLQMAEMYNYENIIFSASIKYRTLIFLWRFVWLMRIYYIYNLSVSLRQATKYINVKVFNFKLLKGFVIFFLFYFYTIFFHILFTISVYKSGYKGQKCKYTETLFLGWYLISIFSIF